MKVPKSEATNIDFSSSTKIRSYSSHTKSLSVAQITVNGRHPKDKNTKFIGHDCHVIFYVIRGEGKVVIEGESYDLKSEDTITIPAGRQYYIVGDLDYLASTSPAYYPEQNEIVKE